MLLGAETLPAPPARGAKLNKSRNAETALRATKSVILVRDITDFLVDYVKRKLRREPCLSAPSHANAVISQEPVPTQSFYFIMTEK